jgi:hypothetical protein
MMQIVKGKLTITVELAQPADAENMMRALVSLMRNIDDSHHSSTDLFYLGMLLDAMLPEEKQVERMLERA